MEYTLASTLILGLALLVAVITRVAWHRWFWLGLFAFLLLTALADSTLVAIGVFAYDPRFNSGLTIGRAPLEDYLYGAALYAIAVTAYHRLPVPGLRVAELFRVSRPYSWINTALPCLACGLGTGRLTLALALGAFYFSAPYNLLLYGVNDVFDYESDRRNPRKGGVIEGAILPPAGRRRLWAAVVFTNLPLLIVLGWLGGGVAALALVVTALVAIIYSAPPLRTKVLPGLDSLTSALHFVLPAVCGGLLAGAALGALPWRFLVAFLFWGLASHSLGAIQDIEADRGAGIGSVALSLGGRPTAVLSLLLYTLAAALVASGGGLALIAALALVPYALLPASCLFGDLLGQARRAWRGFLGMNLLSGFVITQVLLHAWGIGRMSGIELLAWGSAIGVAILLLLLVVNQRRMRRSGRAGPAERVTIVIPVRDEQQRIAACLRALPDGPEIIVVDDGSRDDTVAAAKAALGWRGRVVVAGMRPQGWTGKCWAAWQGAQLATRDVIVFLDADTLLEPAALQVAAGEAGAGGLVSFVTRYTMTTALERALMPAFSLLQVAVWPQGGFTLANGPFMAVRRDEYLELEGHRAISGSLREDLDLARLYAAQRRPVRLLRGVDLAATRHYTTVAQVTAAWRRMYYAYSGQSLAIALAGIAGLATVFLLPPILLIITALGGDRPALVGAIAGCVALLALRLTAARYERQPLRSILWHPVTWLATLAAMASSVGDGIAGRVPVWRGTELRGDVS